MGFMIREIRIQDSGFRIQDSGFRKTAAPPLTVSRIPNPAFGCKIRARLNT
jgi:hypothetical protein